MAPNTQQAKIVIIGSGPAGLTAAIYAGRANFPPILVEGLGAGGPPGGQLALTTEVENFPGFPKGILGPALMADMRAQAERFGARFIQGDVERVRLGERPFVLEGSGIEPFQVTADALIVATGAQPRRLHLPAEDRFWGRGVTACATCDGMFYKNEDVVVVGGGDTAMEEATYLAQMCRKVTIIHRREAFRSSKIMIERARRHPRIAWETPMIVDDILGDEAGVHGVRLRHAETGRLHEIAAKGFFLAIGHEPNSALFRGQLELDPNGYLLAGHGTATSTSVGGVFAAGDVADHVYRQAITAAASGCQAAIDAERWLGEHAGGA